MTLFLGLLIFCGVSMVCMIVVRILEKLVACARRDISRDRAKSKSV